MKEIDLNKTIYELTEEYPELIDILSKEGFRKITSPIIRKTIGKITKLQDGCRKQGKDFNKLVAILKENGFVVKVK